MFIKPSKQAVVFGKLLLVALGAVSAMKGQSLASVPAFSADRMMAHIRTLASNEFQGRGPGTKGEELSIAYIQKQFRDMGLEPGNPDGSYLQVVPLVGIRPDPNMTLTMQGHGKTMRLAFETDFVAQTRHMVDSVHLDADMIFVGYGVQGFSGKSATAVGTRESATTTVKGNGALSAEFIKLLGSPGACFGDSGGPDLVNGNTMVAITSFTGGNPHCNGVTYSERVDTTAALTFIGSFLS